MIKSGGDLCTMYLNLADPSVPPMVNSVICKCDTRRGIVTNLHRNEPRLFALLCKEFDGW